MIFKNILNNFARFILLVPQEGVTNAKGKATALILNKDDVVQLREIEATKPSATSGLSPLACRLAIG